MVDISREGKEGLAAGATAAGGIAAGGLDVAAKFAGDVVRAVVPPQVIDLIPFLSSLSADVISGGLL